MTLGVLSGGTGAALVALGTVLGLDAVSVGQTMLSRPIVGATLAGACCGDPAAGAAAGVLLEFVALETLPVGASRYPDWAPAGVTAGALAALGTPSSPALALGVLLGIAIAWVSGRSMVTLRNANGRRLAAWQAALDAGDGAVPARLMGRGIAGDALRACLISVVGVALVPIGAWIAGRWRLDPWTTGAVTAVATLMVTASSTRQMFHGVTAARGLFAGAFIAGVLLAAGWYA